MFKVSPSGEVNAKSHIALLSGNAHTCSGCDVQITLISARPELPDPSITGGFDAGLRRTQDDFQSQGSVVD